MSVMSCSSHPSNAEIRVKFISRVKLPDGNIGESYLRRFPGGEPVFGNCRFLFDRDCRDYDWLVVYDDLPRDTHEETLACPRENTLLLTGEPSSITRYGKHFLAQFGHVLTSQEPSAIQHPNLIRRQAGLFWYYGGSDKRGTYDALSAANPPEKTLGISCVCSSKAMRHTMHSRRLAFVQRLMRHDLPEIEVWGYGIRDLQNKADAIDPYKYHLTIENHSCDHHWTEKLADAFLGYSLPIYFGCTNLNEYFPPESYVWIDIRSPDQALATLRQTLAEDPYQGRLPAIIEARRRVIEEYATFPQLARLIAERHPAQPPAPHGTITGRRAFRQKHPVRAALDAVGQWIHR
jgi:hypothetical protein